MIDKFGVQETIKRIVRVAEPEMLAIVRKTRPEVAVINYQYGQYIDIVNGIQEWSRNDELKIKNFPLIALIEDFPVSNPSGAYYAECNLAIIIAVQTEKVYTSSEAQVHSFYSCLNPIYKLLLEKIYLSGEFVIYNPAKDMPHQKIDRKYWGKNGLYQSVSDTANEYIDAIEIRNLVLKIETNSICN